MCIISRIIPHQEVDEALITKSINYFFSHLYQVKYNRVKNKLNEKENHQMKQNSSPPSKAKNNFLLWERLRNTYSRRNSSGKNEVA